MACEIVSNFIRVSIVPGNLGTTKCWQMHILEYGCFVEEIERNYIHKHSIRVTRLFNENNIKYSFF